MITYGMIAFAIGMTGLLFTAIFVTIQIIAECRKYKTPSPQDFKPETDMTQLNGQISGKLSDEQIEALDPQAKIKYLEAVEAQAHLKKLGTDIVAVLGDVPIQTGLNVLTACSNALLAQAQGILNTVKVKVSFGAPTEDKSGG